MRSSRPALDEPPRLLDARRAASFLGGVSVWTLRRWVDQGHLRPVRLPACWRKGENCRRLLFDRRDLNSLIDMAKQQVPR